VLKWPPGAVAESPFIWAVTSLLITDNSNDNTSKRKNLIIAGFGLRKTGWSQFEKIRFFEKKANNLEIIIH
jgi:hypothetical protein